jgi:hypothetical protein
MWGTSKRANSRPGVGFQPGSQKKIRLPEFLLRVSNVRLLFLAISPPQKSDRQFQLAGFGCRVIQPLRACHTTRPTMVKLWGLRPTSRGHHPVEQVAYEPRNQRERTPDALRCVGVIVEFAKSHTGVPHVGQTGPAASSNFVDVEQRSGSRIVRLTEREGDHARAVQPAERCRRAVGTAVLWHHVGGSFPLFLTVTYSEKEGYRVSGNTETIV